ncbi:MAG TPA: diaminopimelate decarboxylase [Gammaproteobacteria bacterium]|nr:diaminopimelate decarboxylase [Gammaproteobacteria bacterium]
MQAFTFNDGVMHAESVPLPSIAEEFGTPTYVYSRAFIEHQWRNLDDAFGDYPHDIHYAVKANSNIAVLNVLAQLGSGFDIVSAGELYRVLQAGGDASKIVFSGVAKSRSDIEYALNSGVGSLNIESTAELKRINSVALELGKTARIALRVNPDVDPQTHPYISTGLATAKFGISIDAALEVYQLANSMANIQVHGVACHIGSQITTTSPFSDALDRVIDLVERLAEHGIHIKQLDLGGGLGIRYANEQPPTPQAYVAAMLDTLKKRGITLPVAIEPGRYIVGNAGVLLSRVEYLKTNTAGDKTTNFAIIDAGMNDLMRPSLYQAHHNITAVDANSEASSSRLLSHYEVVGPVCESADVLGSNRALAIGAGDLIAIESAGAYSFVMASNYNSRPRTAEVMVDGDCTHLIRARETMAQLIEGESTLPSK